MLVAAAMISEKADAAEWTGCYAGGGVGYGASSTEADIGIASVAGVTIDGLSSQGATLTGLVGCDMRVERFVFGAFADYTWHDDSEFTISASLPPIFSGNVVEMSIDNEWSIGGRAGYLVTPDVLAYGLVAYSKMEMSDLDLLSSLGGPSFDFGEFDGWAFGGGVDVALGGNLFLKAEYRWTDYDSETVDLIPGFADLKLDPDVHSARVALTYKLGMPSADNPAPLK